MQLTQPLQRLLSLPLITSSSSVTTHNTHDDSPFSQTSLASFKPSVITSSSAPSRHTQTPAHHSSSYPVITLSPTPRLCYNLQREKFPSQLLSSQLIYAPSTPIVNYHLPTLLNIYLPRYCCHPPPIPPIPPTTPLPPTLPPAPMSLCFTQVIMLDYLSLFINLPSILFPRHCVKGS